MDVPICRAHLLLNRRALHALDLLEERVTLTLQLLDLAVFLTQFELRSLLLLAKLFLDVLELSCQRAYLIQLLLLQAVNLLLKFGRVFVEDAFLYA